MTRHYKKYLPYIIFFSTLLVGAVTMLTAIQVRKPPEEEPVVPVPVKAKEGFQNVYIDGPGGCKDDDGYFPPLAGGDSCKASYFIDSACTYKDSDVFEDGTPFAQYKISSVKLVEKDGKTGYEVKFEAKNVRDDVTHVKIGAWLNLSDDLDVCGQVRVTDVDQTWTGGDAIAVPVDGSETVFFEIPSELQWCGCFSLDTDLLTYSADGGNKWIGCGGGDGLPGTEQSNGLFVVASGGVCQGQDYTCPITPRGIEGYDVKSAWLNDDESTNTIEITWAQDIQNETGFELHIISDGTPSDPSEGIYYLMGEENPLARLGSNTFGYTWVIPDEVDKNGNSLLGRTYYRFLVRATYDGSGDSPFSCYQQSAGGRIERVGEEPGTRLVCNRNFVCEEVVCQSGEECVNDPKCGVVGDSCDEVVVSPVCESLAADPTSGDKPLRVEFTGSGSGPANFSYKFEFGDGESISTTDNVVYHTYNNVGAYTARLFVVSGAVQSQEIQACTASVQVNEVGEVTHLECSNNACVSVSGSGTDECALDSDCQGDTHLVCRNKACVRVSGSGNNECSTNGDCVVSVGSLPPSAGTVGEQQVEAKPLVPETGKEAPLVIYIAIGIGLMITGAVVIRNKDQPF